MAPMGGTPISCNPYQFRPTDPGDVLAQSDYGGPITALVARGNIAEASSTRKKARNLGQKLISNFLQWRP